MDSQQQSVYNFSQQMDSNEQAPSSSNPNPIVNGVVSTPIYKNPHILDRELHINLATPFEKLEVLCESLVDFQNMRRNGIDLAEELKNQGWGNYFQRLYGPVYTNLVKELWRFADADDHYIVSYVLGDKMVITEKSIAALLGMEKDGGRRIYNINPRAKYLSHEINPTIFKQNAEGNHSKNEEQHQNLRQGVDISGFNISQLLDEPPNFMKRPRGPSEKAKKAKKAKQGESSGSRPPVPLTESSGKSVSLAPSVQLKTIASSIPKPPPIYTTSDTPPLTTRTSTQPSQKFNLATTTLPISEADMLKETTSPSSSSSPESPPYYNISTDTEPSDLPSPNLAQLQTRALASQQPTQSTPEPEVTSSPTEQPNPTTSNPPPSETTHAETQPPHSDTPPPYTFAEPQTPTLNLSPLTSPPQPLNLKTPFQPLRKQ
ncbi:leucine-rich repeat extensin-like protein 2 [Lathyrus oleraceus]|uniref:leucine-rich repeat extensin-like protein 2 n=1 Tax=Pisum sativum TaxID=3888 RepID=UPI0021CEA317|nr:leucine-rich repeat extensin-like protein 2 [Pisum sativum]